MIDHFFRSIDVVDIEGVLSCFTPEAKVHTPFAQAENAHSYFSASLSKTKSMRVRIDSTFENIENRDHIAVYIRFSWEYGGFVMENCPGVVLFVFEPGEEKIVDLTVIYDSINFRYCE